VAGFILFWSIFFFIILFLIETMLRIIAAFLNGFKQGVEKFKNPLSFIAVMTIVLLFISVVTGDESRMESSVMNAIAMWGIMGFLLLGISAWAGERLAGSIGNWADGIGVAVDGLMGVIVKQLEKS